MMTFPAIGDNSEHLYIRTYSEFHMTNDSDLFNTSGDGWPLIQGGMIHHYNAHFKNPERFIVREYGEERLAKKWKCDPKKLPDRTYRIAWRDIAQPTDTRSLICTILPKGVFVGNTLNLIEVLDGTESAKPQVVSGINALLSSTVCDFYVRQRMAKHVSAFILKELQAPRDLLALEELGRLAMPLYQGDDFESFRDGIEQLDDDGSRDKLIAKIDAKVARMYNLSYEEYQAVLDTFPLIGDAFKKRCLMSYNDWLFEE